MDSRDSELEWVELKVVYEAPDEDSAIHVQALLRGAGFHPRIRSAQIPCFDGAFASAVGYWGQVVVPPEEEVGATELVTAFRRAREGIEAKHESDGAEVGRAPEVERPEGPGSETQQDERR